MISASFLVAIPATTPRLGRLTACAVRAESLENLAGGAMVAAGVPPSLQPSANLASSQRTRLLVRWLRRVARLVLLDGGSPGDADDAGVMAAFLKAGPGTK